MLLAPVDLFNSEDESIDFPHLQVLNRILGRSDLAWGALEGQPKSAPQHLEEKKRWNVELDRPEMFLKLIFKKYVM